MVENSMETNRLTEVQRTAYEHLAHFIVENNLPMHLNLNQVAQCDIDAFNRLQFADINNVDDLLKEWTDGQGLE